MKFKLTIVVILATFIAVISVHAQELKRGYFDLFSTGTSDVSDSLRREISKAGGKQWWGMSIHSVAVLLLNLFKNDNR